MNNDVISPSGSSGCCHFSKDSVDHSRPCTCLDCSGTGLMHLQQVRYSCLGQGTKRYEVVEIPPASRVLGQWLRGCDASTLVVLFKLFSIYTGCRCDSPHRSDEFQSTLVILSRSASWHLHKGNSTEHGLASLRRWPNKPRVGQRLLGRCFR